MNQLLLIALLGSSGLLFSQAICTGTAEECREAQKHLCTNEPAPANLELTAEKLISGTVFDASGAPLSGEYQAELRTIRTRLTLQTAKMVDGAFSFERVQPGSYRLIVVWMRPKGRSRPPLMDQPSSLACDGSDLGCRLSIRLKIHGADNPMDFCPPK